MSSVPHSSGAGRLNDTDISSLTTLFNSSLTFTPSTQAPIEDPAITAITSQLSTSLTLLPSSTSLTLLSSTSTKFKTTKFKTSKLSTPWWIPKTPPKTKQPRRTKARGGNPKPGNPKPGKPKPGKPKSGKPKPGKPHSPIHRRAEPSMNFTTVLSGLEELFALDRVAWEGSENDSEDETLSDLMSKTKFF